MAARWITNWFNRCTPLSFNITAAVEKWINNLVSHSHDRHGPYSFMHTVKEDISRFVLRFTTPNLIRHARRGPREDCLSIDGQFSIAVEGFTMQMAHVTGLITYCPWPYVWPLRNEMKFLGGLF